jgi:hypothetical protein
MSTILVLDINTKSLKILKWLSEAVNLRRKNNGQNKRTKRQTMIDALLYIKHIHIHIAQHETQ